MSSRGTRQSRRFVASWEGPDVIEIYIGQFSGGWAVDGRTQDWSALAASRRITWRSVRPRWAAALDELLAQRPSATLFALAEEDALTVLCGARDAGPAAANIQQASTYAPPPDQPNAQALWHRLMLSH